MAKFCGKCGANIENAVGFCPNCGQRLNSEDCATKNEQQVESKNEEISVQSKKRKPQKDDKTIKKQRKKKHLLAKFIAVILCVFILTGGVLGTLSYFKVINIPFITNVVDKFVKKTPQEAYATEIVNAFNNNDMSKINDIIFNNNSLSIDDNIGATFEDNETKESNKGVLSIIFAETHLTLIRVENNKFVYEVEAPDMNGVFDNISSIQTQDELIKHIEKYAKDAKHKKSEVSIEFIEKDDSFIADYKTEEFINAITGGLVNEYKGIFTQYMDEIISKG